MENEYGEPQEADTNETTKKNKEPKRKPKTKQPKKRITKKKTPSAPDAPVVAGTEASTGEDVAVSRLESNNKRPIRRNWQHKADMDKQFNRLFRLIRNKKKIDTLRRAIQPKNGNSHTVRPHKQVKEGVAISESPEVAYNKSVALIAAQMRECTNMKDLGDLQECVAFQHRVFNDWQRTYLTSKQFITHELETRGAGGAYETFGIKKFFVPTNESIVASLERYFRTLYHFNIEVGPLNPYSKGSEQFHVISSIQALYAITRPDAHQENKKTNTNSNSSSSSSCNSNNNTDETATSPVLARRPDTFDGSTAVCVICNIPMINDAQHGESVCPSCGVVSRGTHNHEMTFQQQQQSSLRGAAPYERIAHVSFFVILFVFFCYTFSSPVMVGWVGRLVEGICTFGAPVCPVLRRICTC